ncbi:MAG: META domain-containing protein [Chloroflexota bacterium]|jgi:heat shock protein HslJ
MIRRLLVWMMCAVMLVGCGQFATNDLVDTKWQLQAMNGQSVPTGLTASMDFTADTFGGLGFCNNYGGNYQVRGNTLTLTQTAMTMMACLGDNRDQLEQQHMAALGKVVTYNIDGDTLTLFDQENVSLLQFVRVK